METIYSLRINHGSVQTGNMLYSQDQPTMYSHPRELYEPFVDGREQQSVMPSAHYTLSAPEGGVVPANFTYLDISPQSISPLLSTTDYSFPQQLQQSFKKIRLQDKQDMQPLHIDTKDPQEAYNPQVEAISPTLPDDVQDEDTAFCTTMDDLLLQMGKVELEITKAESQISILKKKQQELENVPSKPEDNALKQHQSFTEKIYAENRRRAQQAHSALDSFGPQVDWPVYNQPSDIPSYADNQKSYVVFKQRLLAHFRRLQDETETRRMNYANTYADLMQELLRKVERVEASSKWLEKEAVNVSSTTSTAAEVADVDEPANSEETTTIGEQQMTTASNYVDVDSPDGEMYSFFAAGSFTCTISLSFSFPST